MKKLLTTGLAAIALACSSVAMSADQVWESSAMIDKHTKNVTAIMTTSRANSTDSFSFGYVCNAEHSVAVVVLPRGTKAEITTLAVDVDNRTFRKNIALQAAGNMLFFVGQDAADVTDAMIKGKMLSVKFDNVGKTWAGSFSLIGFTKKIEKHIDACSKFRESK